MSVYSSEPHSWSTNVVMDDIPPPPTTAKVLFMDTLLHTYPLTQEIFNATEYTSDIGVALKHFTWLWEGLPNMERQGWIDEHYRVSSLYQELFPDWERNPQACQSIIPPSPEEEAEILIQKAFRKFPLGSFEATVQRDFVTDYFDFKKYESLADQLESLTTRSEFHSDQYESLMNILLPRMRKHYDHSKSSQMACLIFLISRLSNPPGLTATRPS